MNIFVMGRSVPERKTELIGMFEFEQAKALASEGLNVTYIFCDNRSIKATKRVSVYKKNVEGVNCYGVFLPAKGLPGRMFDDVKTRSFKAVWKKAVAEAGKPDILHVHFPLLVLTHEMIDFVEQENVKLVVTEHWTKVQDKEISTKRKNLLIDVVNRSASVIAVSKELKGSIRELTGSEKRIDVIPNMIGMNFSYEPKESTDEYRFVSVGRIVPVKNFDLVVNAFYIGFKDKEKVSLSIIGNGEELSRIKKLAKELGVADRISFLGYMNNSDVADYMKTCDALVCASSLETFGVPWIEAWCSGIPAIGIYGNPIEEYFTEENSMQFNDKDVYDLAATMIKMYENKDSYNHEQISKTAISLFARANVAKQIEDVYESVI